MTCHWVINLPVGVLVAPIERSIYTESNRGPAMTFDEILDQAIALLQRRGRLTYRAQQRPFDHDDAYLADLSA